VVSPNIRTCFRVTARAYPSKVDALLPRRSREQLTNAADQSSLWTIFYQRSINETLAFDERSRSLTLGH
jgi:hypothetical protein